MVRGKAGGAQASPVLFGGSYLGMNGELQDHSFHIFEPTVGNCEPYLGIHNPNYSEDLLQNAIDYANSQGGRLTMR